MKRSVVLAVLALASGGVARAQGLPAPQFATPAANDSSSRAATTAWVRSLGLLSATGDLSQATARPSGALTSRTLAARAADVFNVLDYGAVADGSTDIGPALNAIAAKLGSAATSNVIYFPNGVYRLASAVTFAGTAPILVGQGFSQGPGAVGTGTWIKIDQTGFTPITFSGTNARGAKVRDLAFYQTHPAPAVGWAPTPYDYVFRVQDALGEVTFDNVLFAGVNRGIYADNSGRLHIKDVQGQFYTTGIEIDDCYDIPRIGRLHAWTFATSAPSVVAYQEANADAVLMRRADGIFVGDLFVLGMYSALRLSNGANGVTTKAYVSNLYADFVNHGLLVDGPGSDIQIANMTSQNNDQTNSGTTLPSGHAIWINTTNATVQVGNLFSKLTAGPAVQVDGSGNRVNVSNLRANTFGTPGAGTPAVFVADSGGAASNQVYVGNKEQLQGVSPLVLFNTATNGGRQRFVMMNDVGGGNQNEARGYSATPGAAPQLAAIGGDTNIDLYLNGKGSSGVRLQSSGQTVLRADNLNGSTNAFLLRGGAGTMNWIAEGGDANIDVNVAPKGPAGGVRLQSNGSTVLRVDNANTVANDLLVRASTAALNLIAEGGDSNIDVVLSPKGGAGGVRLQANGGTVLRVDNPGPGTSDLLVRAGNGTVALTVEDPGTTANLVLNPKGSAGLVSTGNCPAQSDNSNNLACTSWVKSWVLAQGYGAGGGGITALTGDVVASGSGSVTTTLANVGTAGSYAKVTTDTKGRVVAGGPLSGADITTALGFAPLAVGPGVNTVTVTGAASGAAPKIAASGGDTSVDLLVAAAGTGGSTRLLANGGTVLRVDNPGSGDSGLLLRSGTGVVSLTVESGSSTGSLSLVPKSGGTIAAPTMAPIDNSTAVATTAYVKSQGYALAASPVLTGAVAVPTPSSASNGDVAASTAFVRALLPCVQPRTGRAYTTPFGTSSTTPLTNTSTVQSTYAVPIIVCGSPQVSGLAFEITTAVATAFSARLALYADAGGQPVGAPLADTGTMSIAANATGAQLGTISGGQVLNPGVYWITIQTSYLATPATVRSISASGIGGVAQALGYSLAAGAATAAGSSIYKSGTFGPPPSPFGTPTGYTTNNIPLVWVQF